MLTHPHFEEDRDRVMATNLLGVWIDPRANIPRMIAMGDGVIVNATSVLGPDAARDAAADYGEKHAVFGLTRAAALDYPRSCIRVNAVCLGSTRTPMIERVVGRDPEAEGWMMLAEPTGRLTTRKVAEVPPWHFSDTASSLNGYALVIEGDLLARLTTEGRGRANAELAHSLATRLDAKVTSDNFANRLPPGLGVDQIGPDLNDLTRIFHQRVAC